jgi:hypothetical protein
MAKLEGKFHATVMTPTSFCGSVSSRSFAPALWTVNANLARLLLLSFQHASRDKQWPQEQHLKMSI